MQRWFIVLIVPLALLIGACADTSETPPATSASPSAAAVTPTRFLDGGGVNPLGGSQDGSPEATPEPPSATYTVQVGTIINELRLTGQVAAVQQSVSFAQGGVLDSLYVESTMVVTKGQLLAELEMGDLFDQLGRAQEVYEQDRIAIERETQAAQLEVQRAQIALDGAQTTFEEMLVPSPEAIAQAEAAVRQAKANLELVRNNASAAKTLAEQEMYHAVNVLTQAQQTYSEAYLKFQKEAAGSDKEDYDTLREALANAEKELIAAEDAVAKARINYDTARGNEVAEVQNAEAAVYSAQATLNKLRNGPEPSEISAAQREIQLAQVALDEAKQRAQINPERAKQLAADRFEIQAIEDQVKARQLFAPIDGVIASVEVQPGGAIQPAIPIITVVEPGSIELLAEVAPSSSTTGSVAINVGQQAAITFSRYSDQVITGTITRTPSQSQIDPLTGAQDQFYHIIFDADDLQIEVGDLADASVVLGRKYDALWLPPEAIRSSRTGSYVTMQEGGEDVRVNIEVGIITTDRVEILSGLEEGDIVIVR